MKLSSWLLVAAAAALLPPLVPADAPPSLRPPARDRLVLEPEARIDGRLLVPAFYRPAERSGYLWIESQRDEYGRFFPGYWEPLAPWRRTGGVMAWVPGYYSGGAWIEGYWRLPAREGYSWQNGYFDGDGRWHEPAWTPVDPDGYLPFGPVRVNVSRLSRSVHFPQCYCSAPDPLLEGHGPRSFSFQRWYPVRSSCFSTKYRPIETVQHKETVAP